MAFSTRSGLIFLLSLLFLSIQSNARSYSFGKFRRENPKEENPNLVPVQTNETNEQDNQNPPFLPESGHGYGLYGHDTTYNNNEDQYLNNKKYDDSFSTPSLSQTQESYNNYPKTIESYDTNNNNKDTIYYDNNNKDTIYYDNNNKDTIYYDNNNNKDTIYEDNSNGYAMKRREKEAYIKGYNNNVERQGMSDTRFMSNGKYYYDLDDERNHGLYYQNQNYNNYKPTGYNEKSRFKNPYSSKNMMNEQSEMFGEEQGDRFTP